MYTDGHWGQFTPYRGSVVTRDRQTDRQTRHTPTDRQTEKNRQTNRHTDRQTGHTPTSVIISYAVPRH